MAVKRYNQVSEWWILAALLCLAVAVMVAAAVLLLKPSEEINSFQACKDRGGAILESYPERCMLGGRSFTNENQSVNTDTSGYMGLEEQAALQKAAAGKQPARVVERDGESLPVTMDFVPGRLNFSVRDGKVDRVRVEGEE